MAKTLQEIAHEAAVAGRASDGAPPAGEGAEEAREGKKRDLEAALAGGAGTGEAKLGDVVDLDDEDDEGVGVGDDEEAKLSRPLPSWVTIPADVALPRGWIVWPILCRAKHTNTPKAGDRWCLLWNLTEADEKLAAKRARGEGLRVIDEMAKQMIRVIGVCGDGAKGVPAAGYMADWGGSTSTPGSVAAFWSAIGGKYRHAVKAIYLKNHTFSPLEQVDFFEHCVSPRSVG